MVRWSKDEGVVKWGNLRGYWMRRQEFERLDFAPFWSAVYPPLENRRPLSRRLLHCLIYHRKEEYAPSSLPSPSNLQLDVTPHSTGTVYWTEHLRRYILASRLSYLFLLFGCRWEIHVVKKQYVIAIDLSSVSLREVVVITFQMIVVLLHRIHKHEDEGPGSNTYLLDQDASSYRIILCL